MKRTVMNARSYTPWNIPCFVHLTLELCKYLNNSKTKVNFYSHS